MNIVLMRPQQTRSSFQDAAEAAAALAPEIPMHCLRPHIVTRETRRFAGTFPGKVLYALKANPHPLVIAAVGAGGAAGFDVASIDEIAHVRRHAPGAKLAFMNPVKPRAAIARAYHEFGVRCFALQSEAELSKIMEATGRAHDLTLLLRIAPPSRAALWGMSDKFGATPNEAPHLLHAIRHHAAHVGLCFHVGSLCLDPSAWTEAVACAVAVIRSHGILPDILDIGGGFPVAYEGFAAPTSEACLAAALAPLRNLPNAHGMELWCEVGRGIAAPGGSLVVRVIGREGDRLTLNDGIYGGLAAPGPPPPRPRLGLPVRVITPGRTGAPASCIAFGPTCDGADQISGTLALPSDVAEGDYLEFLLHGAYGAALRSDFNGLGDSITVTVADEPSIPERRGALS